MTKGVFSTVDGEFKHLVNWFMTSALHSQRDKKSKTYVALYKGDVVGFICISISHLKAIPGIIPLTKSFEFQVLQIGKLFVDESVRNIGIGKRLVDFALDISQTIDEMVGCIGIVVDAKNNERTINFYTKYGFELLSHKKSGETIPMFFKLPEQALLSNKE